MNHALGRVISNSNDYGCILLIDERYTFNTNKNMLLKCIRNYYNEYNSKTINNLCINLKNFFHDADIFIKNKLKNKEKIFLLDLKHDSHSQINKNNQGIEINTIINDIWIIL